MSDITKQFENILVQEPLGKYSTFQIGGPADYFYLLKDREKLAPILEFCRENKLPFYIFAGGSNILFHDHGFRGLVIKIEIEGLEVTVEASGGLPWGWWIGAGALLAALAARDRR